MFGVEISGALLLVRLEVECFGGAVVRNVENDLSLDALLGGLGGHDDIVVVPAGVNNLEVPFVGGKRFGIGCHTCVRAGEARGLV